MKKIFAWTLIFVLLVCLVACDKEPETHAEGTILAIESTTEGTTRRTIVFPSPDEPETIDLTPIYYLSEYSFTPSMRVIYYTVQNELIDLCPPETIDELFEKNKDLLEPTEMAVVRLVKHCSISRVDFDAAIKKTEEKYISWKSDMMHEDNELPIADIIYTFDNEIINAYYRRENPVAPDWLGTERAKDFTYESYSEYLKANPQ